MQQHVITVIPEIEMPGHGDEVVYAYPEFVMAREALYTIRPLCGEGKTYTFLENVLKRSYAAIPFRVYIHVGEMRLSVELGIPVLIANA